MILRTKLISSGVALLATMGISGLASHHSTPASPPPSASVNLNTTCTTSGNTFKITTTNNTFAVVLASGEDRTVEFLGQLLHKVNLVAHFLILFALAFVVTNHLNVVVDD